MDDVSSSLALSNWLQLVRDSMQNEWIRNYLLNGSAGTLDLEILTSKVRALHSVIGTINLDIHEDLDIVRPLFRCTWLLVPAFTFQNFSALILTLEREYLNVPLAPLRANLKFPTLQVFRTIRDNFTGTMLSLHIPEESDFAKILIISADNMTRQRSYFELEKSVLESGNILKMWNSVQYHVHYSEKIICKLCMDHCSCRIPPFTRPEHRMDLGIIAQNFGPMTGHFSGVCTLFQANSRGGVQNAVLGDICRSSPPGSRERLASWSISEALTKYFSEARLSWDCSSMKLISEAYRTIADYLSSISTSNTSLKTMVCAQFSGVASNAQILPILDSSAENVADTNRPVVSLNSRVLPNEDITMHTDENNECPVVYEKTGFVAGMCDGPLLIPPSSIINRTLRVSVDCSFDSIPNVEDVKVAKGLVVGGSIESKTTEHANQTMLQSISVEKNRITEAKYLRRRLRNRELAAKSNEKKREKLVKLRKDLKEGKEKIKRLKTKQRELKESNSELGRLVLGYPPNKRSIIKSPTSTCE